VRTAHPAPSGLSAGGRFAEWAAVPPAYIALDVDGTLLRAEQVPSRDILDVVAELVSGGTRVGLATGRMAAASEAILATGVFTGPHVFHNGAVVTDGSGIEELVLGLTAADVAAVLELGRGREDLVVEVYVGRSYLADRRDPRSAPHARLLGADPSGTIDSIEDLAGREAIKAVVLCFSAEAAEAIVRAVDELGLAAGPAASPATPGIRYVNVTRAGVDKGSGVLAAARSIDVEPAAVAFLGDETNDVPALDLVGTAIAMGDAPQAIIDAAHLVAPSYDAQGARTALRALATLTR
jgi:Cof subfamily protein (haloacid dehalogenase superfamily)